MITLSKLLFTTSVAFAAVAGCSSGALMVGQDNPESGAGDAALDGATSADAGETCCEDGLTWLGCCGTPSNPGPHACGSSPLCHADCREQHACSPPVSTKSACETAGFQCVAVTPPSGDGAAGACPAGMTDTGKSCDVPGGPTGDFMRCCAPSPVPDGTCPSGQKRCCTTSGFQCVNGTAACPLDDSACAPTCPPAGSSGAPAPTNCICPGRRRCCTTSGFQCVSAAATCTMDDSACLDASAPDASPDGNTDAGCCEDGLTWQGCCSTAVFPNSHLCGNPAAACEALCMNQHAC